MPVAMMQVRKMRVAMAHRDMAVAMRMRFRAFVAAMRVLMMSVMDVAMLMVHGLVLVLMPVPLGKDEPSARGGQGEGGGKRRGERLA